MDPGPLGAPVLFAFDMTHDISVATFSAFVAVPGDEAQVQERPLGSNNSRPVMHRGMTAWPCLLKFPSETLDFTKLKSATFLKQTEGFGPKSDFFGISIFS